MHLGRLFVAVDLGPNIVHISYLPLAHIYERIVIATLMVLGGSIGFYQGEIPKLMDDISKMIEGFSLKFFSGTSANCLCQCTASFQSNLRQGNVWRQDKGCVGKVAL